MRSIAELKSILSKINHRPYPAYKDTKGSYNFHSYVLHINHVQSDPFASPSDVSITIEHAGFPAEYLQHPFARIAIQDALIRLVQQALKKKNQVKKASGKSGQIRLSMPGQQVLERTALEIDPESGALTMRFQVGFPAHGRKIESDILEQILCRQLPKIIENNLVFDNLSDEKQSYLQSVYELACNQQAIREYLKENDLQAFVANGSMLPRLGGHVDLPMKNGIPFKSPESLEIEIPVPFNGPIKGMKIPSGVTLIVGGGYQGKSTLLEALEKGVYNHISGDGREYVITREDGMKIRAEDGRAVHLEDISMFIQDLPTGKDTREFDSQDASGSTSQAANVIEALDAGSQLLLMDEDTSAANFMVRDDLMASVVAPEKEPIIPFLARIQPLYQEKGISTILVAGSSGAGFDHADLILQMDTWQPYDITDLAREKAAQWPHGLSAHDEPLQDRKTRIWKSNSRYHQDKVKVKTHGTDTLSIAKEDIDTRYLEQLADSEQLSAIGKMMLFAQRNLIDGNKTLPEVLDLIEEQTQSKGLSSFGKGALAKPRRQELAAVINRQRSSSFGWQQTADENDDEIEDDNEN